MCFHPKLRTPVSGKDFRFPYETPYPGQLALMKKLFEVIEEGKIGIFESPTGTGKSLSLLCGGLSWLRENDVRHELEVEVEAPVGNGQPGAPLWILRQKANLKQKQAGREIAERKECVDRIRTRERLELARLRAEGGTIKRMRYNKADDNLEELEDEFLLDNYDDTEAISEDGQVKALLAQLAAMDREDQYNASVKDSAKDEEPDMPKIYYASRTHSQLAQLIQEFARIPSESRMGCVTLGSRANLCINQSLVRACKGNNELINERCSELQKQGTKVDKRCQYYLPSDRPLLAAFRDQALAGASDVEDLVKLGQKLGTCAYYGARKTVRPARIVAVPYNLLLQSSARSASDINLKNQIVIIDEAHNLIESIENSHSPSLSFAQIQATLDQLSLYLGRYRSRLLGQNTVYLSQAISFLKQLVNFLNKHEPTQPLHSSQLLHALGLDMLNLLRLATYLRDSRLAHKLHGFVQKEHGDEHSRVHIYPLEGFLLALARPDADGSFLVEKGRLVRYVLLNPADPFRGLLEEARAVILIGGTLAPLQDFVDRLCPGHTNRVVTFSCGHVVPATSLKCFTLSHGLRDPKRELIFSFQTRSDPTLLDEVGSALGNLAFVIPDGIVCFFASHAVLDAFYSHISKTGQLKFLEARKRVFREPQGATEAVLQTYQSWIDRREELATKPGGKGAILLCVVGGRLSEGINFSDAYGRGVIVVGLPFPNLASPDLKLKMEYLDKNAPSSARAPSKAYYENLCMRAVNQSIGRAIRHAKDYAVMVLLDARYGRPLNRKSYAPMLPDWIQPSIVHCNEYGQLAQQILRFFKSMRDS